MRIFLTALVLLISGYLIHAQAPTTDDFAGLKKQIEKLLVTQERIERELQQIKRLVQAQPSGVAPPIDVSLSVEGAISKGKAHAKVTVIEFSDYECPFCAQFARETWPLLERDYIQTGKIKYVFLNLPIETLHKNAMKAHEAALCADEQGKYWEMRDLLFLKSPAFASSTLVEYAGTAGLKLEQFQACLTSGKFVTQIRRDLSEAQRVGVTGTPTFFVGKTPAAGQSMQTATVLKGAQPYAAFKQAINQALETAAGP